MSKIWQLLGIEPTNDTRAIRSAFAKQSRSHHIEEEPEYFEKLHQAYKQALQEAQQNKKIVDDTYIDTALEKEKNHKSELENECLVHLEFKQEQYQTDMQSRQDNDLLNRLDDAQKQRIQESMCKGALHDCIMLFESGKQANKTETWKHFFLSDAFLAEQFSEEFGEGLYMYLKNQTIYPFDNLPMGFLQELAIAYALLPHFEKEEYFEDKKYPKEWYKVSVEHTFLARKYAAEILNMQGRDSDLKSMTGHIKRMPANKVRYNSFLDYLTVRKMSQNSELTEHESAVWQHILHFGKVCYLYERNGKQLGSQEYEARSECVVRLYVQWLKDEKIPEWVLRYLYKEFSFRELEHSSTRGLYGALKEQVLIQYPTIEECLFGKDAKEQQIKKFYRAYSKILNDYHSDYEKSIYWEEPAIQESIRTLFAMPEWQSLHNDIDLFYKIYDSSRRLVMPNTISKKLIEYASKGDFPEPQRTQLLESLLRSLRTNVWCRDIDYRYEVTVCNTSLEDIGGSNVEFWYYFLMRGFGYRHTRIRGDWETEMLYETDGNCYLPAYINYICAPSKVWQRHFVGFDEEKEMIESPISAVFTMPNHQTVRVEFHYHYCLYFVDEVPVIEPVLSFSQLCQYAKEIDRAEHFFFLLAITAIDDIDRSEAKKLIADWLTKVPIDPIICPVIARMLAADNDRISMALSSSTVMKNDKKDAIEAVVYSEQERFCFRAVILEMEIRVFRQVDFGWEDKIFRKKEFGWKAYALPYEMQKQTGGLQWFSVEQKKEVAYTILGQLRQPKPVRRVSYTVNGLDIRQKTEAILKVLEYPEKAEGYCVLRYADQKEKRHDRVFYGTKLPFGFDLAIQSEEYKRSMNYLLSTSESKIKEEKTLVWRFGWGFQYSPKSHYGPMFVYLGKSGTYYAYGTVRMHRADNLIDLLTDFFRLEFEDVTEVVGYTGCLTVSRFDHRLEYCYQEKDFWQSIYDRQATIADGFTIFAGYQMWIAFAKWLDSIFDKGLPEWIGSIGIGLDWKRGYSLSFVGYPNEENTDTWHQRQYLTDRSYIPQVPCLIWGKGMPMDVRKQTLNKVRNWYVECGTYAKMLCDRKITIVVV